MATVAAGLCTVTLVQAQRNHSILPAATFPCTVCPQLGAHLPYCRSFLGASQQRFSFRLLQDA